MAWRWIAEDSRELRVRIAATRRIKSAGEPSVKRFRAGSAASTSWMAAKAPRPRPKVAA
jgi:hypothetical protein